MFVSSLLSWGVPKSWAVPWDVSLIYKAFSNLRGQIGIVFDVGIWVFIGITGIYLVLKIFDSMAH